MQLKKCKSCGKEIYFLITKKGGRMPVDAESLTEAEKRIIEANRELIFKSEKEGGHHMSHFATCDQPKKFRKVKKNDNS